MAANGPSDAVFDTLGTLPVIAGLAMLKKRGRFIDIHPTQRRMLRGFVSGRYKMVFATSGFKSLQNIADVAILVDHYIRRI
ncbi:hypothetical protein KW419_21565 [Vibrio fluvialis]|nr:hypothetical protein [Vibrio fluvialis]